MYKTSSESLQEFCGYNKANVENRTLEKGERQQHSETTAGALNQGG